MPVSGLPQPLIYLPSISPSISPHPDKVLSHGKRGTVRNATTTWTPGHNRNQSKVRGGKVMLNSPEFCLYVCERNVCVCARARALVYLVCRCFLVSTTSNAMLASTHF